MEKETSLVKSLSGLAWKTGDKKNLIINCADQTALRKILSEGLYQAVSLYSDDTKQGSIVTMVQDLIEDYKYDPVNVIIGTIDDIRKGRKKIYGRVNPADLREMITEKLDSIALDAEADHHDRKGYGEVDLSERDSSRNSDGARPIANLVDKMNKRR
jgi:hypothetical protein